MSKKQLSAEVTAVLADIELKDGRMAMPAAKLTAWRGKLKKLVLSKRKPIAAELLAMAARFLKEGQADCATAVAQLVKLSTDALNVTAAKSGGWSKAAKKK